MATVCATAWDIVALILYTLLVIFMIILTARYIHAYASRRLNSPISLFWAGLVFFIAMICHTAMNLAVWITYCSHPQLYGVLMSAGSLVHAFRSLLLLGILFYRLYLAFKESALCLSNCTLFSFSIYYGITVVIRFSASIALLIRSAQSSPDDTSTAEIMLSSFAFLNILLLNLFLISLFIYKLAQVYKSVDQHGHAFIALITKTSVLFFASTVSYLLYSICVIAVYALLDISEPHWLFIPKIIGLVERGTCFLAIFLTYRYFDGYYVRICGWLDLKCSRFWRKCIGNQHNAKESVRRNSETEIQSIETATV